MPLYITNRAPCFHAKYKLLCQNRYTITEQTINCERTQKSLNKSLLRIKEVQQPPYGVLFLVAGVLGISHNPFSEKSLDGVSDIKVSKLELNP